MSFVSYLLKFLFQFVNFALQGSNLAVHLGQLGVECSGLEVHLGVHGRSTDELFAVALGVADDAALCADKGPVGNGDALSSSPPWV